MTVCPGDLDDYNAVSAAFDNLYIMMTEDIDIDRAGGRERIPKISRQLVRIRERNGRKGLVRSFGYAQQ